ncbi:MAG: hypothetical protein LC798_21920 [Chloroflexi bacterium]|nr:hypothetical protein [Chloroflexota bacterium]
MTTPIVAIPVENGIPASVKVTSLPDGAWTLAFLLDGGRKVEPFGEPYASVRAACRVAERMNAAVWDR